MPTGYTHSVQTGEVTSLRIFAMQCARAFGALITMRDEPQDAPIPERLEPSDWHNERLVEARQRIEFLLKLTPEQCEVQAFQSYENEMREYRRRIDEDAAHLSRYKKMLAQTYDWQVPPDIAGLKKFMIEQLTSSIDFDCGHAGPEPSRLTADEWLARETKEAESGVRYHTKERAAEIERTEERNRWLSALRSSLPSDAV